MQIWKKEEIIFPLNGLAVWLFYRPQTCLIVILGLAFQTGQITAGDIFQTAFLEELYQNSIWGVDKEAKDRQSAIRTEFKDIERFMNML